MANFIRPDLQRFAAYSSHVPMGTTSVPEIVDHLDTNESSYDLPAPLKEKLAGDYQAHIRANRYPSGDHHELRNAIAHYAQSSATLGDRTVTAKHITVGNGSDELIRSLLIATCVGRPGAILVAEPTFSMYKILAQTLGVDVVTVGRDEETFEVDLDAAEAAIANAKVPIRMIFMVSPNSPTGNALTTAELNWLRQLSQDILVVVDEAYFEFCGQTTVVDALARPNWVVTRTFSKAFRLAAHRVGYVIAAPEMIQVLEKVRLPYNLPTFSQTAALVALRHAQSILSVVEEVRSERDRLLAALKDLPDFKVWPSAANFVYCRPTQGLGEVFQKLYEQGTHVRQTGGGFRITVGTPEENNRTLEHLRNALMLTAQ
ncbi:histidinol-phosphate transaminase [Oscillatoria sp. CS-180]|uniref:histidinol-phosphate transaminase n=1 Tax=Oscillatoria sp. CS-180 TaxID=3021720 RepID=UPI00232D9939|nr:histidinol-phosphate transaminase [Oscillatoria sp. CS-180]MDB9528339.1 histidinol-phosphate transaminase [Oscillatoria sp. CS-180]